MDLCMHMCMDICMDMFMHVCIHICADVRIAMLHRPVRISREVVLLQQPDEHASGPRRLTEQLVQCLRALGLSSNPAPMP